MSGIALADVLVLLGVAVILGAILWPKFLRSGRAANEAAAVATLKEIGHAEITYAATYPAVGFAGTIDELGGKDEPGCVAGPTRGCLLGTVAKSPHLERGYRFGAYGVGVAPRREFWSTAVPEKVGQTGQLSFCSSNRWVVRYRADGVEVPDGESCEALARIR